MTKSKSNKLDDFTKNVMAATSNNLEIARRAEAENWSRYNRKVKRMTIDGKECMVVW